MYSTYPFVFFHLSGKEAIKISERKEEKKNKAWEVIDEPFVCYTQTWPAKNSLLPVEQVGNSTTLPSVAGWVVGGVVVGAWNTLPAHGAAATKCVSSNSKAKASQ